MCICIYIYINIVECDITVKITSNHENNWNGHDDRDSATQLWLLDNERVVTLHLKTRPDVRILDVSTSAALTNACGRAGCCCLQSTLAWLG